MISLDFVIWLTAKASKFRALLVISRQSSARKLAEVSSALRFGRGERSGRPAPNFRHSRDAAATPTLEPTLAWFTAVVVEDRKRMPRRLFLVSFCVWLVACASSIPRLHQPDRIDQFCGDRAAVATAIESIVSSTGEASGDTPVPSSGQILNSIKQNGGIIAHWNDQPLYAPSIAKLLGVNGDYVTLGDAAIGDAPRKTDSRPIFLTVKRNNGRRTFALRAYDIQDVCNQGKLSS